MYAQYTAFQCVFGWVRTFVWNWIVFLKSRRLKCVRAKEINGYVALISFWIFGAHSIRTLRRCVCVCVSDVTVSVVVYIWNRPWFLPHFINQNIAFSPFSLYLCPNIFYPKKMFWKSFIAFYLFAFILNGIYFLSISVEFKITLDSMKSLQFKCLFVCLLLPCTIKLYTLWSTQRTQPKTSVIWRAHVCRTVKVYFVWWLKFHID